MVRPTHPGGQAAWRIQRVPVEACVHSEEPLQVGPSVPAWSVASAGRHRLRIKDTARDWPRGERLNSEAAAREAWRHDEAQTLKDLKYEA